MSTVEFQPLSIFFNDSGEIDLGGEYYIVQSGEGSTDILKEFFEANVTKIVISLIICVFGLIGNLVAIFVIAILKEYQKSVTHWYVLHLAVADSIFLISLPFQVSEDLNNEWILPEWMCKAKETILFMNYYASILFLVVMSIDRYIAVCHTFSTRLQKLRKRGSSFIIACSVWAIAILLCIPVMLYSFKQGIDPECKCTYAFPKSKEIDPNCVNVDPENFTQTLLCEKQSPQNEQQCLQVTEDFLTKQQQQIAQIYELYNTNKQNTTTINYDSLLENRNQNDDANIMNEDHNSRFSSHSSCNYWNTAESFRIFLVMNFALMFVLPLLIMLGCYGLIVKKLSDTRVQTQTPSASFTQTSNQKPIQKKKSSSRSDKDRRRVTMMCAALVSCFVACWLPFHSIHLAKIVGIQNTSAEACMTFQVVGSLLAYFNSALNPYLYSFLGTNFAKRWSSATVTLRQTVSRQRNSSSNSGSIRHFSSRKVTNRKHRSTKTGTTKVTGNHPDTTTKNSASESTPAFIEMTRPLGSHSDTRNFSSTHYYSDQKGPDFTKDFSSEYKQSFSVTES